MLAALGPIGFSLLLMAFMPNLWTTTLIVLAFFFAYYVYEPPYRGLYPDLMPAQPPGPRAERAARAARGASTALVGGGFLSSCGRRRRSCSRRSSRRRRAAHDPFIRERRRPRPRVRRRARVLRARAGEILREEPDVRRFLLANAAWEGTFAAARTFVVLYIVGGWRQSGDLVGRPRRRRGGYVIAALSRAGSATGSGSPASSSGPPSSTAAATSSRAGAALARLVLRADLPVAVAGGTVMTLAWGLLFKLTPPERARHDLGARDDDEGARTARRRAARRPRDRHLAAVPGATSGYQVLWPICALPVLLAIPLVGALLRVEPTAKPEPQLG